MHQLRTRRRIALYSHDTQGLGHVRRNIAIAAALVAAEPRTDVLVLTGAPEATVLPLPPSTEVLTLPTLGKDALGAYSPRVLDMPMRELLAMRGRLIASALASFRPDLLVVDKVPRGVGGELDRALRTVRTLDGAGTGRRTRTVLGLRDVLDDPVTARREWDDQDATRTIARCYDQVWVYGDPAVFDPVRAYHLPPVVAERVVHTGYLAAGRGYAVRCRVDGARPVVRPRSPYVLCMIGGGQDGVHVARAFAEAPLPAGHSGVLVTGPYLQPRLRAELAARAERRDDLAVHELVTSALELIQGARAVVSMGGYNTVCEVLAAGCPALVVPRVVPRVEQAIRADRLAELGLVDTMPPALATPEALGEWLSRAVQRQRPARGTASPIDLDGLARLPGLVDGLLAETLEVPHVAV